MRRGSEDLGASHQEMGPRPARRTTAEANLGLQSTSPLHAPGKRAGGKVPSRVGLTAAKSAVQAMQARQESQLRIANAEHAAKLRVNVGLATTRPVATVLQYNWRQEEFREWCKQMAYPSDMVTKDNFLLFITHMSNRPPRTAGTFTFTDIIIYYCRSI